MTKSFLLFVLLSLGAVKILHAQRDSLYYAKVLDSGYQLELSAPRDAINWYAKTAAEAREDQNYFVSNKVYLYSGLVMSGLGKYDSARFYYKKALPFAQQLGDKGLMAGVYINMANSYQYESDFKNAISFYQKGIDTYQAVNDTQKLAISYQNLASVFSNLEDYDRVNFYLQKALNYCSDEDLYRKALIYNDLALSYLAQEKTEESLKILKESEVLIKQLEDDNLSYFLFQNYGEYYSITEDFDEAIVNNLKALDFAHKLTEFSSNYYLIDTYRRLGMLYGKIGNLNTGESYLKQALEKARESGTHDMEEEIYTALARLEQNRNPQAAFAYLERARQLSDSLHQATYTNKLLELDKRFEVAQKDREILAQQLRIEEQEVLTLKQQNRLRLAIGGVGTLLLFGLLGIYYFKQRQQQRDKQLQTELALKQKEALIQGEEDERNRIARELHDGINGDLCAIKYLLTDSKNSEQKVSNSAIDEAVKLLDASNKAVRNIATNLAPPAVEHFGFTEAVREYCTMQARTHTIEIDFSVYGEPKKMEDHAEVHLYRIIQELINNSLKHAEASELLVQLNFDSNGLQITVEDNGKGFSKNHITPGNGLKNIEYRLGFLDASIDFESGPEGTSYYITKNG